MPVHLTYWFQALIAEPVVQPFIFGQVSVKNSILVTFLAFVTSKLPLYAVPIFLRVLICPSLTASNHSLKAPLKHDALIPRELNKAERTRCFSSHRALVKSQINGLDHMFHLLCKIIAIFETPLIDFKRENIRELTEFPLDLQPSVSTSTQFYTIRGFSMKLAICRPGSIRTSPSLARMSPVVS